MYDANFKVRIEGQWVIEAALLSVAWAAAISSL